LYPEVASKQGIDAAVERMRSDIEGKLEGQNAFELTFGDGDAQTAAKGANRLPQLYAEQELQARQNQAPRATPLLSGAVEVQKQSVTDWERKIAQFKIEHAGELPEQMEVNLRALERIATSLRAKSDELTAAEGRRSEMARAHHSMDTEAGRLLAAENAVD